MGDGTNICGRLRISELYLKLSLKLSLKLHLKLHLKLYLKLYLKSNWNSNKPGKKAKDLYEEVVIDVTNIIEKINIFLECQYNGSNVLSLNSFNKIVCHNQSLFEIKEYYFNGDCLILTMPDCLSKSGVLEIALQFNVDVHIFLHHKGKAKFEIIGVGCFLNLTFFISFKQSEKDKL